jgi:hypothetical protein
MRRVAALLAEVRGARVAELVTAVLPDMVPLTSLEGVSVTSNVANCAARGSAGAEALDLLPPEKPVDRVGDPVGFGRVELIWPVSVRREQQTGRCCW